MQFFAGVILEGWLQCVCKTSKKHRKQCRGSISTPGTSGTPWCLLSCTSNRGDWSETTLFCHQAPERKHKHGLVAYSSIDYFRSAGYYKMQKVSDPQVHFYILLLSFQRCPILMTRAAKILTNIELDLK